MRASTANPLRSKEERDKLVEQYLPLVRYVAERLPVTMPGSLDRDDFNSIGVMGLMHAAAAYDPTRGASFKTFAYTAIRGAILDEIRKHDPIPRSRRDRLRKLERAKSHLRADLHREPTIEELAEHMEVKAEDLDQDLLALHTFRILSLDETYGGNSGEGVSMVGDLANTDDWAQAPDEKAVKRELVDKMARAISELPEVDRHVVVLYHYENLFLKEIGEILGVSESRVSQILTRALARVRARIGDSKEVEEEN